MAEDLTSRRNETFVAADVRDSKEGARSAEGRSAAATARGVHRVRFAAAYVVLALLGGTALGAAIVIASRPEATPEPAWSSWRPTGRGSSYPSQIAEFVSSRYDLSSGTQLATVLARRPEISDQNGGRAPIEAFAIETDPEFASGQFDVIETKNAVMYEMCGLGAQCSLRDQQPASEQLHVRREALELALYSFRYVDGLESVLVVLPHELRDPQRSDDDLTEAILFRRRDFRDELARPERSTLAPAARQAADITSREALTIVRLTDPRVYQYQVSQTLGGWIMVLAPNP